MCSIRALFYGVAVGRAVVVRNRCGAGGQSADPVRGLVIALLLTALCGVAIPPSFSGGPTAVAQDSAVPAVFEPMDGATSFGPAAFGRVVTDGDGTFLATQRVQLPVGQFIGVRRSVDGGRNWATVGMFAGSVGAATQPWISVSGSRVAVGFIGGWCDPATPGCAVERPIS